MLQYSRKTPDGVEQTGALDNGGLSSSENLYLYLAPLIEFTIFCGEPQQPLSSLSFWPQWLAFYGARLQPPKTLSLWQSSPF